jgi:hypothetical protein
MEVKGMSSTNQTANFNFPQWVGSDYPSFINDLNPAFLTIDTKLKSNETGVDSAQNAAESAQQAAEAAQQAAEAAQTAAKSSVDLLVAMGITNKETAVAFAGKVNNAIPKNNVLAEYFDHEEN